MTEETIFAEAVQKAPPERAAYLDRACAGDSQLRAAVEALLQAYEHPDTFLDNPLEEFIPTETPPTLEKAGDTIGPYRLDTELARGGMGVVFAAEQQGHMQRRVALKIIKPGMGAREVIGRFEGERQALAKIDRPNIAKAPNAGAVGFDALACDPPDSIEN